MAALGLSVFAGLAHAETLDPTAQPRPNVLEKPVAAALAVPTAAMASVTPSLASPPAEIAKHISDAAAAYVIDRNLLEAVAWKESRFKQEAKSGRGAAGVMQLMPAIAKELGVDRADARQNVFGGAAYLKELLIRFGGDVSLALAAYNAGPGAVLRYGGVPPFSETRNYVAAITGRVAEAAAAMTGQAVAPKANYTILATIGASARPGL